MAQETSGVTYQWIATGLLTVVSSIAVVTLVNAAAVVGELHASVAVLNTRVPELQFSLTEVTKSLREINDTLIDHDRAIKQLERKRNANKDTGVR